MHSHDEPETSVTLPQTPLKPPPKKRRWWLSLLWLLLTLVVVVIGSLLWLTRTEAGLRFSLFRIPTWFGVEIEADKVAGNIWNGFEGDSWVIKTEGANIRLNHLKLDWASSALFSRTIHVRRLDIGEMNIEVFEVEPRPKQEAQFPKTLRLPANIHLDEVVVHQITLGAQKSVLLNHAKLSYHYNQGQAHRLNISRLDSTFGIADGFLQVSEDTPFTTDARLNLLGSRDGITVQGHVKATGDLQNLVLNGDFNGEGVLLKADGVLHPFAPKLYQKLDFLRVTGKGLNPKTIIPSLPEANIDLNVKIEPVTGRQSMQGSVLLSNTKPLHIDANGIPVREVDVRFTLNEQNQIELAPSYIHTLLKGKVNVEGVIDAQQAVLDLDVNVENLTLADVVNQTWQGTLAGDIDVSGSFDAPQADWRLNTERLKSSGRFNMLVDRENGQQSLEISKANIVTSDSGVIDLAGKMNLYQEQAFKLSAVSQRFNPAALSNDYPKGNVNFDVRAEGTLAGEPVIKALLDLGNSSLSGAKLSGKGDIVFSEQHLSRANVNVLLDGNRIKTDGSIGKAGDRLNIDVNAPRLDQFGFGLSGLLTAKGHVAGSPKKLDIQLTGQAQNLRLQDAVKVQNARFDVQASPTMSSPLKIDVSGKQLAFGTTLIDEVNVKVNGTGQQHTINGNGQLRLDNQPYRVSLAAQGGLNEQLQWKGAVSTLDIAGAFNARLNSRLSLEAGAEKVALGAASWGLMNGSLNLSHLLWQAGEGLTTKGNAKGLDINQIKNLVAIPIEHNLIIGGDWDLKYGQNMSGFLRLNRQSGDIILPQRNQKLGLSLLATDTSFTNNSINTKIKVVTQYASVDGQVNIGQTYGQAFANAPLSGRINVVAKDLATVRNFLPVGMEISGAATANVTLGGSIAKPQLSGPLNANHLSFLDRSSGVYLKDGSLKSHFSGMQWVIESLTFREKGGTAVLSGVVGLAENDLVMNLKLALSRFEVLSKPNQLVMVSGDADLLFNRATGLSLNGDLKVDRARFDFPRASAPSLSDDVIVVGRNSDTSSSKKTPIRLNVLVDLNNAFRFNGQGLDVLLGGRVRFESSPERDVTAAGQIRVLRGRYKSYGQDLVIQNGYITFVDDLQNPTLNIRAERRGSPVGAGIEVTGSLSNPHTVLVANEPMSDKDKLSWLILGRPSNGESDDAAVAAAAGAWLAGNLNDKIGIVDNIGLESRRTRNAETGEMNAAEQVINVSKRLTNQLSLGYEYGLNSAESTVKLVYYISRSLQVIGRVGSYSSGGEVRYTIRFDGFSKPTQAKRQAYEAANTRIVESRAIE